MQDIKKTLMISNEECKYISKVCLEKKLTSYKSRIYSKIRLSNQTIKVFGDNSYLSALEIEKYLDKGISIEKISIIMDMSPSKVRNCITEFLIDN